VARAEFSPAQISGLSATQISVLSKTQFSSFSDVDISTLSVSQIKGLNVTQVNALSTAQVDALSKTQIAALSTTQVGAFSRAGIAELSTAQIAGLSTTQLRALNAVEIDSSRQRTDARGIQRSGAERAGVADVSGKRKAAGIAEVGEEGDVGREVTGQGEAATTDGEQAPRGLHGVEAATDLDGGGVDLASWVGVIMRDLEARGDAALAQYRALAAF